jgi:hypothetical protein
MTDLSDGDLGPNTRAVVEQLLIRSDDLEHAIRRTTTEDPAPRHIYPAEGDPGALRVEISPAGISAPPNVALIAIDDPKYGDEREAPVRIVISPAQADTLVRRLRGVLDELCGPK